VVAEGAGQKFLADFQRVIERGEHNIRRDAF